MLLNFDPQNANLRRLKHNSSSQLGCPCNLPVKHKEMRGEVKRRLGKLEANWTRDGSRSTNTDRQCYLETRFSGNQGAT